MGLQEQDFHSTLVVAVVLFAESMAFIPCEDGPNGPSPRADFGRDLFRFKKWHTGVIPSMNHQQCGTDFFGVI